MTGNRLHRIFGLGRAFWQNLLLLLALPVLAVPSAQSAQPSRRPLAIRYLNLDNSIYLYLADVAAFYGMSMQVKGKEITFKSKFSTISFTESSRLMTLNNAQFHLSRPIKKHQQLLLMGKSDFSLVLEPILRPMTISPKRPLRTILIDPGHGGKDVGAVNGKDYEKDLNLAVALRLATQLRDKGFKVYMTRNMDTEISLDKRTQFSDRIQADLFVSIHCNSASATVNGLETYIATPKNDPNFGVSTITNESCPANKYDKANAYLAYYTQRELLQKVGMTDRGVRRKRFYVIRNTNCPSMLIEIGYITNTAELAKLKTPDQQQKIADAITEGILKYRNATK